MTGGAGRGTKGLGVINSIRRYTWTGLCLVLTLASCQTTALLHGPAPVATLTAIPTATVAYPAFVPTLTPAPQIETPNWARHVVLYRVNVASFYDSNDDGVGDLPGLIEMLDYLNDGRDDTSSDLGINALELLPVFRAASWSGADCIDPFVIRPEYGTREDLLRLLDECHRRGMRVVLDYAMSYVSDQHPFFQHAYQNLNSVFSDWFIWYDHAQTHYEGFSGNLHLPALQGSVPAVQEYAQRVALFWMDPNHDGDYGDGADGFCCLDAHGLPHAFWQNLRAALKAQWPDVWLLGEVPGNTMQIAAFCDQQFDAMLDTPLHAVWCGPADAPGQGVLGGSDDPTLVYTAWQQQQALYPSGTQSVNYLSGIANARLQSVVSGNMQRVRLAATWLLTWPGIPQLYYGDEIGMPGRQPIGISQRDEYYAEPMDWYTDERGPGMSTWFRPPDRNNCPSDGISVEEQTQHDDSLLSHYRRLIRLRAAHPALRQGSCERVATHDNSGSVLAYLRESAQEHLFIVLNVSHMPVEVTLDLGASSLPAGPWSVTDLLTNQLLPPSLAPAYALTLPPQSDLILLLQRP